MESIFTSFLVNNSLRHQEIAFISARSRFREATKKPSFLREMPLVNSFTSRLISSTFRIIKLAAVKYYSESSYSSSLGMLSFKMFVPFSTIDVRIFDPNSSDASLPNRLSVFCFLFFLIFDLFRLVFFVRSEW